MGLLQSDFENMIRAYLPDLYRYAYWLCKDEQIAEEIVQESLLRAWRRVRKLKDLKAIKSWLLAIVRNEHNHHYSRKYPESIEITETSSGGENMYVHHSTDRDDLRKALYTLDAMYREPIILNVLMGFSVEDISVYMGLRTSVVCTRLFRAKEKLRSSFNKTTYLPRSNKYNSFHPTMFGYVTSAF